MTLPFWQVLVREREVRLLVAGCVVWFGSVSLLPFLRDSLAFPLSVDTGLVRQIVSYSGYLLLGNLLQELPERVRTGWLGAASVSVFVMASGVTGYLVQSSPLGWKWVEPVAPLIVLASAAAWLAAQWGVKNEVWDGMRLRRTLHQLSAASFGVFLSHELWSRVFAGLPKGGILFLVVLIVSFSSILVLQRVPRLKNLVS